MRAVRGYVLEGCLRSFYVDDKGDEHTLHFALERLVDH